MKYITLLLMLCLAGNLHADHASPTFEIGTTGAIMTTPGSTLQKDKFIFGSSIQYLDLEEIPDAVLEALGQDEQDVHSVNKLFQYNVNFGYGFSDGLTVGASLPYVERHDIREAHHHMGAGEVEFAGDSKGIGDLRLFSQYRFFKSASRDFAVLAGIKTPTGKTDERSLEGELFEVELQPGSGSWDPFIGLAANHSLNRVGLSGNILYTFATEGDRQTNLGNILNYNFAGSYRIWRPEGEHSHDIHHHAFDLLDYIDLALELNGSFRERVEINGLENDNSGGHFLLISPGARIGLAHRWSFYTSVGIPLVNDLNGVQSEIDLRIIGGFSLTY